MSVFDRVVGQSDVVAQLEAAVIAPVHAYLLAGPPGAGARAAAEAFAAALLCPRGGCGECRDCRLALSGEHPDVVVHVPAGASMLRAEGEEIVRLALRSPVEGTRKVIVLHEMHRVSVIAPMLLKTIEEPPASTVFVLVADFVPTELVTIASRCVRIDVRPLAPGVIESALVAEGIAPEDAAVAAAASGGSVDRARLLASDRGLASRREQWALVPRRLDGSGATVAVVVDELRQLVEAAGAPLTGLHDEELAAHEGTGRKQLEDAHRRAQRRHRAEELRFGLATLAGRYGDALAAGEGEAADIVRAVRSIDRAAEALVRNPNETLLLQALLLQLPSLS